MVQTQKKGSPGWSLRAAGARGGRAKPKAAHTAERRLIGKLKRALNYIDEQSPGPGSSLAAWAEIHDELLTEIHMYDPKWSPGDEATEEG